VIFCALFLQIQIRISGSVSPLCNAVHASACVSSGLLLRSDNRGKGGSAPSDELCQALHRSSRFLGFAGGPSALVGCKSCSPSEPSTSPSRIGEWPFAFYFFYEMRLPSSCGLRGRNDKDLRSIFLRYVRAYSGIAWKKVMKFVCTPPGVITPKR